MNAMMTDTSTAYAWFLALRPKTLPAAIVPVTVGVAGAYAFGQVRPGATFAALVGTLLLQIGSNFANDVYDHEKGADTPDRVGPTRTVASGLISAGAMKRAMVLVFLLALGVGLYLYTLTGWPVLVIGLASILTAFAYTGGPYPLGYHGLGDVFVMLFFGFVAVPGTFYLNLGETPQLSIPCALAIGALTTAILVVNNVRDVETDARAGKRTLVVRFGRDAGVLEYRLMLAVAYLSLVWIAILLRSPWAALPLLSLPLAMRLQRSVLHERGAVLNATLAGTAKLLLVFGGLLALGLSLSHSALE